MKDFMALRRLTLRAVTGL